MITASPTLISLLKSGNMKKKIKIELLNKDEKVLEEISPDVKEGNISVDKERDIQRNFSLTMVNLNNKFTPGMGNTIWFNKKIKPYIGYELPTGTEWIPQGVFLLNKPVASVGVGQEPQTRIECIDKMAGWGKIINTLTISTGLNIAVVIQLVLDGIESNFNFEDCSETVPYDLTFNPGTERKKIIKDLVDMITWELYYDVYGYLRLKPRTEPENGVVTWTYKHEDYTLYSGSELEIDMDNFANVIFTVGSSSKTATVSAVARDDELLSEFSTQNIGEYLYMHNNGSPDPLISTVQLAQSRSDWELRKRLQYVEKQRINLVCNPLHEAGDVIELIEPSTGTNDKFELLRFNLPLSAKDQMSGECWRVRRLL